MVLTGALAPLGLAEESRLTQAGEERVCGGHKASPIKEFSFLEQCMVTEWETIGTN